MKLFDCNAMLGTWKQNTGDCYETAEEFLCAMDEAEIDKSLVYGSLAKFNDAHDGNIELLDLTRGHERLIPCAAAIPHHTGEFPDPEAFSQFLRENKIPAVRIFPVFHGLNLIGWLWGELFAMLEKLKTPLIIDLNITHFSNEVDFEGIEKICARYSELPVVLTRMSVRSVRYLYPMMAMHSNLYIETSLYTAFDGLHGFAEKFGAERLLFGSNMPIANPNAAKATVLLGDLTDEQKSMIAGENLERLLKEVKYYG